MYRQSSPSSACSRAAKLSPWPTRDPARPTDERTSVPIYGAAKREGEHLASHCGFFSVLTYLVKGLTSALCKCAPMLWPSLRRLPRAEAKIEITVRGNAMKKACMMLCLLMLPAASTLPAASGQSYDINTLAGKVASVNGTAGLQIRFSAFIEEESLDSNAPSGPGPITPANVLASPLDGTSILAPAVTVNQDTAGAPQNETSIAVDPNNPLRIVSGLNDYVTRTWTCSIAGTPCSALGDGYSGTYFSNDGGSTWCCVSTDPSDLGTLIPGVDHLAGGIYDAGGDPAVAFDSQGHVYYSGLGFNRASAPNTVAVNRGTFDGSGALHWSAPTFINQTNSPSTLNDKEWIAADSHASSPFRDRVYVSWTRFLFNPVNGHYVQSPIMFVYSKDGGQTF